MIIGAFVDVVLGVAEAGLRSAGAATCVEGASVGYGSFGLEPGSWRGGAKGAAATDATAVDIALGCVK